MKRKIKETWEEKLSDRTKFVIYQLLGVLWFVCFYALKRLCEWDGSLTVYRTQNLFVLIPFSVAVVCVVGFLLIYLCVVPLVWFFSTVKYLCDGYLP